MTSLPTTGWSRDTPFAVEAREFPENERAAAQAQVTQLLALATELAARRSRCTCDSTAATCQWAQLPGGPRACRLIPELARPEPLGDIPPGDLERHYLEALMGITPAVYLCRRVLHAGKRCWFSPDGTPSLTCGRVLSVAHCLRQSC